MELTQLTNLPLALITIAWMGLASAGAAAADPQPAGAQSLTQTELAQRTLRCPRGLTVCRPGRYGRGGCYRPGYARCFSGRVCSSGLTACPPGRFGGGGCYRPVSARCTAGLICSSGMQVCARRGKRPYCYRPAYSRCR